ncbi:MAG: HAD-IIA family hydrolase [Bifidobacteriaceae bacterium]|nr:HAD-IIA family hydrolase [Bifidobacteriaceae bacterium]
MKGLLSSKVSLSEQYQLALVDLDGVVYVGKNPIEHAAHSLTAAEKMGMRIAYTTNNSSRFQSVVADQLRGFGLNVQDNQVITSAVVAARMVAKHVPQGTKVLVLGAEHLQDEVSKQGLTVVHKASDKPEAVIQGWYPDLAWHELAEASFAVEQGAKYFVTNKDTTIPREQGVAPGCGSMIQAVMNATGVEPIASAGKPESAMYEESQAIAAGSAMPIKKELCLAVGDRLDTDIEAGNKGDYDSLLVFTGVTDWKMLLLAPEHLRPTYIAKDLRGLLEPHEAPVLVDDAYVCGGERAIIRDNALEVSDPTSMNALRSACMCAWSYDNPSSLVFPNFTV